MVNKLAIAGMMLSWLALSAPASVIVSNLNPAVAIYSGDNSLTAVPIDFNGDGIVDFRFLAGPGGVASYIYIPSRVAVLTAPPPHHGGGVAGALPFNLNLGETGLPFGYHWWTGGALPTEDHLIYGDKLITVLGLATTVLGVVVVSGDVRNKNAAIGVEFRIGTNTHYGYIHFDCRAENGYVFGGGYLRGWAYETEPGQPIVTRPVAEPELPTHTWITPAGQGLFLLRWPSTAGGIYRVKGSPVPQGPYEEIVGEVVASGDMSELTVAATPGDPAFFWRVVRTE